MNEQGVSKEIVKGQENSSHIATALITPENTNEMFANSEYLMNYLKSIPEAVNQENTQYNQVDQEEEGCTQDYNDVELDHKI